MRIVSLTIAGRFGRETQKCWHDLGRNRLLCDVVRSLQSDRAKDRRVGQGTLLFQLIFFLFFLSLREYTNRYVVSRRAVSFRKGTT